MPSIGRNDRCPCGSGKKYKHCCLGAEHLDAAVPPAAREHHRLTNLTDERMLSCARSWLGPGWVEEAGSSWFGGPFDERDFEAELELLLPWLIYHYRTGGETVAERCLREEGARLPEAERAVIEANRRAWISIWEVEQVAPGRSLTLRDRLTGERREVADVNLSRSASRWANLVCRLVDGDGVTVLEGVFPAPLGPVDAEGPLALVRKTLGIRTRKVRPERLRSPEIELAIVAAWRQAAESVASRPLPRLANTDGDPLLLTTDHFVFEPADRALVIDRLAGIEGADRWEDETGATQVTLTRGAGGSGPGAEVSIASVRIAAAGLTVETNSLARADLVRRLVDTACGASVRHRIRDHTDPRTLLEQERAAGTRTRRRDATPALGPESIPPETAAELVQRFLGRRYASWPDTGLSALAGSSPREAMKTRSGRRKVVALVKHLELGQERLPPEQRFDFAALRRDLGLDPDE